MEYIYLSANLKFKEQQAENCNEIFASDKNGIIYIQGKNLLFTKFSKEQIDSHIKSLQDFSIENKLHLNGSLIIAKFDKKVKFECFKITNKSVKNLEPNIKITNGKSNSDGSKEKKKPLTIEEKISYIKKFYNENNKFPSQSDTVNGFKIGTFWNGVKKNNDICIKIKKDLGINDVN